MRMPFLTALSLLILLPITCLAVPTGLNMMPTAEALGAAATRVEVESSGGGKLYVPAGSTLYGTEVGALLGVEAGVDQVSNAGTRYNAKWVLKGEGTLFPALAVGIQNVASGEKSSIYAVATKSLVPSGMVKVHGGMMLIGNDDITMYGVSAHLGPIVAKADRINGGPNEHQGQSISAGFTMSNFTVTGTQYDYKFRPNETTVTISYTYKPL